MSSSSPASHRSAFRPDIEGLRGIAVLIVVAFHCGLPGAGAGFIGVDVFFVLSGYFITGLLVKEVEKTGRVDIVQFYARRMRRLLPAASLVTLVTLLAGAAVLAPREMTEAGRAARAAAVYLSNVFFAVNAADYFAADVETNPMLHTWSLAVEEQFYVFWPLLIMVALQWWRSHRALIGMLSGVAIASLALSLYTTYTDTNFAFYSLPTRSWEFAVGGLAALLPVTRFRLSDTAFAACSWVGLVVLAAATIVRPEGIPFPGWLALPPVIATTMMLVAAAGAPDRGVAPALARPGLQFLGKYWYSWYLWHWPFLVFAQALVPTIGLSGKVGAALLSLGVAFVTHRLVENPLRFHPLLVRRPLASLALGIVLMASNDRRRAKQPAAGDHARGAAGIADDLGRGWRRRRNSTPGMRDGREVVGSQDLPVRRRAWRHDHRAVRRLACDPVVRCLPPDRG